jgi:hypothetical protein
VLTATAALDTAIAQCERLRGLLKKSKTRQVWGADERGVAKATALAWFNSQRAPLVSSGLSVSAADASYKLVLVSADKASSRNKLLQVLKTLRSTLIALRSESVSSGSTTPAQTTDAPPSFAPLIADEQMQAILAERWIECVRCLGADAPLAATVMMGGLLEALLLARVNRESDKAAIFTARAAPKDKSGQTKPLNDWMLKNYIEVVHELGWISVSAKDVGEVLRDYRNYLHPFKQLSHGVHLKHADAALFWEISKNISRQVLASVR